LSVTPPKSKNPKVRYRWSRFSLHTLLVLSVMFVTSFGWLGSILVRVREQRRIVSRIESLGGRVVYDYEVGKRPDQSSPPGPGWIRKMIGDDAFAFVERVILTVTDSKAANQDCALLIRLPRLKTLHLGGQSVSDECMRSIASIPAIAELQLAETPVSRSGLSELAAAKELHSLTLWGSNFDDDAMAGLTPLVGLDTLELVATSVSSDSLAHIAESKRLKTFRVHIGENFGDSGMRHISTLTGLTEVELHNTKISDSGLSFLCNLPQLESLEIVGAEISDTGVVAIGRLRGVKHLDIGRTQITDASLETLAGLPLLKSLNLRATLISDGGIDSLRRMNSLRSLNISRTKVTADGLRRLVAGSTLTELRFGPEITREEAEEFAASNPPCHVVWIDEIGLEFPLTID
jgi:internalin A